MVFDQQTRPRRRLGRVIWPLLIAGAAIVAVVVSSAGDESRAEIEYLQAMRTQVAELSRDGDALRDVTGRLSSIERVEFETVIATIGEDLSIAADFAAEDPPSDSLVSIQAAYRLALAEWAVGLEDFGAAVLEAADDPDSVLVIDRLANALNQLRNGDALYETLVAEIAREDTPSTLADMPDVALNPRSGPVVTISSILIASARTVSSGLSLRPGLAISQVIADPEWEVNPSEQAVVPSTESITFSVVVTNLGNVTSEPGTVILVLSGGGGSDELEVDFGPLEPNEQVTVIFSALDVSPGGVYQVDAALAPTNQDSDLTDNRLQVQFTVNE